MLFAIAIIGIVFATLLMVILSVEIISFGSLIAKTPDREELLGNRIRTDEDKNKITSPEKMPKIFVVSFWVIFILGIIILGLTNTLLLKLIGVCIAGAAVVFSCGIVLFEMMIYNSMKTIGKEFLNNKTPS